MALLILKGSNEACTIFTDVIRMSKARIMIIQVSSFYLLPIWLLPRRITPARLLALCALASLQSTPHTT